MELYSFKGQEPKKLPNRIRLSDGTTRTGSSNFTSEELLDAGYTLIEQSHPPYNPQTQKLLWDSVNLIWVVNDMTQKEKEFVVNTEWKEVRKKRDALIESVMWKVSRYESYVRQGLEPIDDIKLLDKYIQDLRDVTKQKDPFSLVWPSLNGGSDVIENK